METISTWVRRTKFSWWLERHFVMYFCNFWWLHRINVSPHSLLNQCLHCYGCYVNKTLKLFQVRRNPSRVVLISAQLLFFRVGIANIWHPHLPLQCMCPNSKSLHSFLWSLDLASLSLPSTEPWEAITKQELAFKIWCICIPNLAKNLLVWGVSAQLSRVFYQISYHCWVSL